MLVTRSVKCSASSDVSLLPLSDFSMRLCHIRLQIFCSVQCWWRRGHWRCLWRCLQASWLERLRILGTWTSFWEMLTIKWDRGTSLLGAKSFSSRGNHSDSAPHCMWALAEFQWLKTISNLFVCLAFKQRSLVSHSISLLLLVLLFR